MEFENINVELLCKNSKWHWESIKDNISSDTGIQLTPRIDGTFTIGTFDIWLDIKYIAPYTPLKITYNNNTSYYVCSPSIKPNLIDGEYFHSFEMLEATALLPNFNLGSKAFSVTGTNTSDYSKMLIIKDLMEQKYGIQISFNLNPSLFNKEREFTFGAGTTLYNALVEIMAEYNVIPYVSMIDVNTETTISDNALLPIKFTISACQKNSITSLNYENFENDITDIEFKTNIDNYCKYLETEAKNVVDRNTLTTWKNLTVRSEDILINADSASLVLPCNVEKIDTIKFKDSSFEMRIDVAKTNGYDIISLCTNYGGVIPSKWEDILWYLAGAPDDNIEYEKEQTSLYKIIKELYEKMEHQTLTHSQLMTKVASIGWSVELINNDETYHFSASNQSNHDYYFDVTERLKEKAEWDNLSLADKPKYMYYESGKNVIKNLHNFYNDSFWGYVTNSTSNPWYSNIPQVNSTNYSGDSGYYKVTGLALNYTIPQVIFEVTATIIVDPFITNTKSINPIYQNAYSEYGWKPFARSYESKAETIEFDKLEERIKDTNKMLGDVELTLELTNPQTMPSFMNSGVYTITYDGNTYYVMAYVTTIRADDLIIKYSLSRTYSKKAEVIGVETQFETTPNPLKNIITRPIYIESVNGVSSSNLNDYYLLEIKTYDANEDNITGVYKRFGVLESANTKLLYCEAINQYALDYQSDYAYGSNYYKNAVAYADDNNEIYILDVALVKPTVSSEELFSRNLPKLSGATIASENRITLAENIKIYKDARERLTFTIKLN